MKQPHTNTHTHTYTHYPLTHANSLQHLTQTDEELAKRAARKNRYKKKKKAKEDL